MISITLFVPYCRFPTPKRGRFKPRPGVQHETYLWLTRDSYLTVTVDHTQNGTSPEVEECNSKYYTAYNFSQNMEEHEVSQLVNKCST
ncbi:unnamed protein product [Taenia asiatica]|uniref:DUF5727 domain-containing protein n=1 Tax=Taenia asiatica TaxID=60517 RepID=A0A3P6RBP1_TAEAS|nr:unnamed protein product [Taenia asiatica]